MHYHKLGRSDLEVSRICLGTMTFGQQNTEAEAHEQLDFAVSQGVNFIDTAELYPVPPNPETQGRTEQYIGSWLAKRGKRDDVIIASKIVGPHLEISKHFRNDTMLDRNNIMQAIDTSLQRLQTDYIDLYQVHWPERTTNFFGKLGYFNPDSDLETVGIETTLRALDELVKSGKVRYIGVSNESAWGVMRWLQIAKELDVARIISIQNPYNLLNRKYEVGLAEVSERENVPLLAYSPLAFGTLSGKYLDSLPKGSRLDLFPHYQRYDNGVDAIRAYVALAKENGLDPAQMALSYVNSRPFMGSNIIGATNLEQLKVNIDSINVILPDNILMEIEAIHSRYTYPCP